MADASATLEDPAAASSPHTSGAHLTEFLLVGGATLVLFPLAWILRRLVGLSSAELAVGFVTFHAATVINDPHFAVTYLLFYKDARRRALGSAFAAAQRARYVVAGLVVPLALLGWVIGAMATRSARAMGLLIQLMFFLVRWHYVKQGFGTLMVLSARRGARFDALERGVILAHCFAGWAIAWASPAGPGRELEEKGVVYTSLAHPAALALAGQVAFGVSTLALMVVLARKWRREGGLPLAPLAGFLITVWLWTVYSSLDRLMVYVIPALHSVQYLYFVWLLKRNEAREAEAAPTFGRPVGLRLALLAASAVGLGWLLFRGAPGLLDARLLVMNARAGTPVGDLGETPYFAAIYVFVNIHHYFMDNVIWRRENPATRYLQHG